jgi:hypothetical protein
MLIMREMHKRFHASTGVTFASLYPGCIASSGLFRNHVPLFRWVPCCCAATGLPQGCLAACQSLEAAWKLPGSFLEAPNVGGAGCSVHRLQMLCNDGCCHDTCSTSCLEPRVTPTHVLPCPRRNLFPKFQKYVTKGFVSEEEAGKRLARVVSDPALSQSGVYWSFKTDSSEPFVNQVSEEVANDVKAAKLWEVSAKVVGL